MYFPLSELRKWSKKTAETRRRNCAVLPLIKRLKAFYSAAGLRPAATAAKNEVNTFLTAAQAVCRETAFIK